MADLTNLPESTTPSEFFQIVEEALAGEPAPDNASPDKAQINLTGDGGGSWTMGFVDGSLKFESGAAADPPMQVTMTVDDWRAFILGAVKNAVSEHVDTTALNPSDLGKLYRSSEKVEALKGMSGDLQLQVTGDATYKATITLGGAAPNVDAPTCTAKVALPDFALLAAGKENPQMAFFSGKIVLEGDVNLPMQLFATLAS